MTDSFLLSLSASLLVIFLPLTLNSRLRSYLLRLSLCNRNLRTLPPQQGSFIPAFRATLAKVLTVRCRYSIFSSGPFLLPFGLASTQLQTLPTQRNAVHIILHSPSPCSFAASLPLPPPLSQYSDNRERSKQKRVCDTCPIPNTRGRLFASQVVH